VTEHDDDFAALFEASLQVCGVAPRNFEEEQKTKSVEVRKSITVGAVITGRVVSVRDFGAFVDLGSGVQGLLHVSEMAWARVSKAEDVVKPGVEGLTHMSTFAPTGRAGGWCPFVPDL